VDVNAALASRDGTRIAIETPESWLGTDLDAVTDVYLAAFAPDPAVAGGDGSGAPPPVVIARPAADLAPVLTGLRVSPQRFRRGTALPRLAATTPSEIRFTLSEPAAVRFTFERARPGRRVARGCRRPSRSNARRAHCTRYEVVRGSFTVRGWAGANRVRFQGRSRDLPTGRYRVAATPHDAAGNAGRTRRATFELLAPRRK
jgi:hypothetical protein